MREAGEILLVSCYELGHQPIAVASASAFLETTGHYVAVHDLAVGPLEEEALARARFVGISVPMHTALRIGVRAARRIRSVSPDAHICFFGLYATLNAGHLLGGIADSVIGGEFEGPLAALVDSIAGGGRPEDVPGVVVPGGPVRPHLARLPFPVPRRDGLPPLARYAMLETDSGTRVAAAVEASRGCLHQCRHCPIPPVYGGRFFVVPREVVLEDVRRLVAAGAGHITFADPDFLNGPGHALAIVRALHAEFPELTFDCTTKIEHILKHRDVWPEMAACGCLFVVSAAESLSARVLGHLLKGHDREDVFAALSILRSAAITLRPSLVPFTPWATLEDYGELLDWIEQENLVGNVEPVQLSIRLLVPPGSLLLSLPAMQSHLRGLKQEDFTYAWSHPDPRMDRLHRDVTAIVHEAALAGEEPPRTFERIRQAAGAVSGGEVVPRESRLLSGTKRGRPPRLTEPWFC